ncbi:MTHFR-domain-containing protein [Punctularia strigosozonata HHB-11173 SS5]|uniref:MTHFR-domain-containing protein n=1 Tax=Punctularia strigosozonata (strain HHB-11173) TaxID=741275 RepID=UPI00044164A2|nr:MTHFR-domain-containing protein [Punctularia strigosozonata HHB-11173 SS5]EIN07214.1 MTHFR-domain-containing protein [Punctularia strigosozonata HHB-11173 SS5]
MKLADKIAAHQDWPFFTFEFFPPKTNQGFENLLSRISRLSKLNPLAISITWGASGTTKDRSLELAGLTQQDYGVDTVLHLTCTNMEKGTVDDALRAAKERGIQNILALRGDPPRGQEYWIPTDPRFAHGIDLVSYIRSSPEFSSAFCIGVAAYPDGHPDREMDEDAEIDKLKDKVDAGADYIVTQLFYDVDNFLRWLGKVRDRGINVPVIPGIMPLQTYSSFLRLTKLCGSKIPASLHSELEAVKHDDQQVKEFGIRLATDMIRKLVGSGKVPGVHFCTLNLEKSVQRVLESLGWTNPRDTPRTKNKLIADTPGDAVHTNSVDSELLVTPITAAHSVTSGLSSAPAADRELGSGEINSATTWDEFPNGRFGDFKSPAFGNQDQWGGSVVTRPEATDAWGNPKTLDDLTSLFVRYLDNSEILTTPFTQGPLSSETRMIITHLQRLNKRGWWTVGSQPAVDGAPSEDEVVGWGPRDGYVFQKCFVEFFANREDVAKIEKAIEKEGGGWISYFAADQKGECRTNVPDDGRNAVTWGIFPGQEIAQSTIIERESFLSWKEEAFSIWSEWASFYPPGSAERKLLESVRDERWLVSVVHHDFKNPMALWTFFEESLLR